MAKISIDVSDKKVLTKEVSFSLFSLIREWLDSLGEKADIVEVVTVRTEKNITRGKHVVIKLVIIDPVVVFEGRIISDSHRPRYEEEIWFGCIDYYKAPEFTVSLLNTLTATFNGILLGRAKKLKRNAEALEKLVK